MSVKAFRASLCLVLTMAKVLQHRSGLVEPIGLRAFLNALVLPLQMLSFGFLPDGYMREIQKIWEMSHLVLGQGSGWGR